MNKKRLAYMLIILFGLLVYGMTAFFNFSYLDDNSLILENYHIISDLRNVDNLFVEDAFFSNQNFYFRPLLNLSFMLDAQISGASAWFYHLSNVFIHITATCLLFAVLLSLGGKLRWSWFLSLVFLLHPVLVQAVAWIPGRNDSLLAVFALASFLFYLKYLKKRSLVNFLLSILLFLLALFTKEAAVFLPFVFAFYYLFLAEEKFELADKWALVSGALSAFFIWFLFRGLAIDGSIGSPGEILNSILNYSPALIVSLGKLFFPFNLGIMQVLHESNIIYGVIAILILIASFLRKRIDKRWLTFGLIWFIIFLLPAFLNPDPKISYQLLLLEHRLYLPFIGIIFIFLHFKGFSFKNKYIKPLLGLIVIVTLTSLTIMRLPNYQAPIPFWEYAIKSSPNSPFAYRNLGVMYYFEGRIDEAETMYKRALLINPKEPMAHNNLGVIYMDNNMLDLAKKEFEKELEVNPGYDKSLQNLDNLLILKNRLR